MTMPNNPLPHTLPAKRAEDFKVGEVILGYGAILEIAEIDGLLSFSFDSNTTVKCAGHRPLFPVDVNRWSWSQL